MANILSGQQRIVIASEATYGTDQVDIIHGDGALDLIYQDVLPGPSITGNREIVEIGRARSTQSGQAHKSLPRSASVSMTFALSGWRSGASGEEEPYYAPALKAGGLAVSVSDATSATYAPSTAQQSGMTVYLYHELDDGKQRLQRATGVRGNLEFNFELDQEATVAFEGMGQYVDVLSDAAQYFDAADGTAALEGDGVTAVTARTTGTEAYAAKDPIMVRAITATVNSNSWCISAMTLSTNWQPAERNCATGTAGLKEVVLTRPGSGNRIGGSFTLATDSDTVIDDVVDLFESGDEVAFSIVLTSDDGGTGDDQITISGSKLQLGTPTLSDNGGIVQIEVPYFLNGDYSDLFQDDDFSIVYDEVA